MAHWIYLKPIYSTSSETYNVGSISSYSEVQVQATGFPIFLDDGTTLLTQQNPATSIGLRCGYSYDNSPIWSDYWAGIRLNGSLKIIDGYLQQGGLNDYGGYN